jgi:hypothetical protein
MKIMSFWIQCTSIIITYFMTKMHRKFIYFFFFSLSSSNSFLKIIYLLFLFIFLLLNSYCLFLVLKEFFPFFLITIKSLFFSWTCIFYAQHLGIAQTIKKKPANISGFECGYWKIGIKNWCLFCDPYIGISHWTLCLLKFF